MSRQSTKKIFTYSVLLSMIAFLLVSCKTKKQTVDYTLTGYDGIDVSRHNGRIDWKKVSKNRNIKYVFIKATEGYGHVDKNYLHNARQAHKHHLKVGIYHYFTSRSSALQQFNWFKQNANQTWQDLVPVVDVEEMQGWRDHKQLQDSLAVFVRLVKKHYGCLPIIYSNRHFYNANLSPRFNKHYLFIASYSSRAPILNGASYDIWQYSEKGRIRGIEGYVDLSRMSKKMTLKKMLLP